MVDVIFDFLYILSVCLNSIWLFLCTLPFNCRFCSLLCFPYKVLGYFFLRCTILGAVHFTLLSISSKCDSFLTMPVANIVPSLFAVIFVPGRPCATPPPPLPGQQVPTSQAQPYLPIQFTILGPDIVMGSLVFPSHCKESRCLLSNTSTWNRTL